MNWEVLTMRSNPLFFSPTVYRTALTRFAPLWIVYLIVWVVTLPLAMLFQAGDSSYSLIQMQYAILNGAIHYGPMANLVYAAAVAMALHGWMYHTRSVNTVAALPIRREAHFLSNLAAAMTFSLGPNLIIALLTWAAGVSTGYPALGCVAIWLALMTLQFLCFYGLAALCAAIVGQLLALPALYFLLNVAAVTVNTVVNSVLSSFVYGMSRSAGTPLAVFSPVFYYLDKVHLSEKTVGAGADAVNQCVFRGWTYPLLAALAGVILLVVSFFLLRRRAMEYAGDVIAVRPLRPVLKYCFTLFCALVLGLVGATMFFSGSRGPALTAVVLCLLLGAFLGYFTAEILLRKTFHVFRRGWVGFSIVCAGLLVLVGLVELDAFGYEKTVPTADQVESITLSSPVFPHDVVITDEAHIADLLTLHQQIIEQKGQQEALLADRADSIDTTVEGSSLDLIYQYRNGRTLARSYDICCTEALWLDSASLPRQFAAILTDPYIVSAATVPNFDVSVRSINYGYVSVYEDPTYNYITQDLTASEAYDLYTNAVLPDLQEGLIGRPVLFSYDTSLETQYMASIFMEFLHTVDTPTQTPDYSMTIVASDYLSLTPTVGSRTAQWLMDHGHTLKVYDETASN